VPAFEFLALRFSLAAVVMTLLSWRALLAVGRAGLRAGALAGLALFAGYAFQTVGLQYTSATNTGLVTGLFVVFAPLLSTVLLRRRPSSGAVIGVVLATAGLGLLTLTRGFHLRYGDAVVLVAAFSFGLHIVILARYSPEHSPAALATVQMWVAAAASAVMSLSSEDAAALDGSVWVAVLVTALLASAAGFYVQTLAQRYVAPTRTAVILVSEPAFAGLAGFLLLEETLSGRRWVGAGLILAGMLAAELRPQRARDEG
jgi:drug/metabolite transporter (DMT)-like permease